MIIRLQSVDSTNRYCEALDLSQVEDFTCYWALEQTAGIGQTLPSTGGAEQRSGSNHWFSGPGGTNLAISIVLKPTFLPAADQFRLTQAISLAICDFLSPHISHLSPLIKWPNDIYVDGRKICGTLITSRLSPHISRASSMESSSRPPLGETSSRPPLMGAGGCFGDDLCRPPNTPLRPPQGGTVMGDCPPQGGMALGDCPPQNEMPTQPVLSSSIVGIGLNVNQLQFPSWVPNPTSLALLTGRQYDIEALLPMLLEVCRLRYEQIRAGVDPTQEYLSRLMNLGLPRRYRHGGQEIEATVTGVDHFGRLLLTTADGTRLCCVMKEIELLN